METVTDKREWLASKGLAKPNSKGRFSSEANEAWNKAIASGEISHDAPEQTVKPVKVAAAAERKPARVSAKVETQVDTKAVRQWAQDNGVEVSARGRISADVVQAYLDAGGHTVKERPKPEPEVQVRPQTVAWGIARRKPTDPDYLTEPTVGLSTCATCGKGIAYCPGHAPHGLPTQPHYLNNGDKNVPVLLVKPEK